MKSIFITVVILLNLTQSAWVRAEDGAEGHGGEAFEQEFRSFARRAANILKAADPKELAQNPLTQKLKNVNPDDLLDTIKSVLVNPVDKAVLIDKNGREVDRAAVNYPSLNIIELSIPKWKIYRKIPELAMYQALHEYFSFMDVEQDNYDVTDEFMEYFHSLSGKAAEVPPASPQSARAPVEKVSTYYVCTQTVRIKAVYFPFPIWGTVKMIGTAIGEGSTRGEAEARLVKQMVDLRIKCTKDGSYSDMRVWCSESSVECTPDD